MLAIQQRSDWSLPAPPFHMRSTSHPLRVHLLTKAQDYHCCLLASLGFSYDCIAAHTGLSRAQVSYRLKRAGLKSKDYRDGKTKLADIVIKSAARKAAAALNHALSDLDPHT